MKHLLMPTALAVVVLTRPTPPDAWSVTHDHARFSDERATQARVTLRAAHSTAALVLECAGTKREVSLTTPDRMVVLADGKHTAVSVAVGTAPARVEPWDISRARKDAGLTGTAMLAALSGTAPVRLTWQTDGGAVGAIVPRDGWAAARDALAASPCRWQP